MMDHITHNRVRLKDIVQVEDPRTQRGEIPYQEFEPLRNFRGNYGVPRRKNGVVVKGFFETDSRIISELHKLHEDYLAELKKYLPVLATDVVVSRNRFHLEQKFMVGMTLEHFLMSDHTAASKIEAYELVLHQALSFLYGSSKVVGIDGKPENWIMTSDGSWFFLDTFPPFLVDGERRFERIFNLRDYEIDFVQQPESSFFRNTRKVCRRLWLKSEKCFPLDYEAPTINVVQHYDKSVVSLLRRRRTYK